MDVPQIWEMIQARLAEMKISIYAGSKLCGTDLRNIQRAAKNPAKGISSKTIAKAAAGLNLSFHSLPNATGGGSSGGDDEEIAELRRKGHEFLAIAAYLEERKKIR